MTDQTAAPDAPACPADAGAPPIQVKANAAPVITAEMFKALVIAGGAFAADRLMHTEAAVAAAIPAGAVVATIAWGLLQRLHTWKALRFLADRAPDDVAVVGRKPWWEIWH